MTASERRELRDDLKTEVEEIDADMVGLLYDLSELRATIAAKKAERVELVARRNALRPVKA